MLATLIVGKMIGAGARAARYTAEGVLRYRAARGAQREAAETGEPLLQVKEVLVVSNRELEELEKHPEFLRGTERARSLHAANQLASCDKCGNYVIGDHEHA